MPYVCVYNCKLHTHAISSNPFSIVRLHTRRNAKCTRRAAARRRDTGLDEYFEPRNTMPHAILHPFSIVRLHTRRNAKCTRRARRRVRVTDLFVISDGPFSSTRHVLLIHTKQRDRETRYRCLRQRKIIERSNAKDYESSSAANVVWSDFLF